VQALCQLRTARPWVTDAVFLAEGISAKFGCNSLQAANTDRKSKPAAASVRNMPPHNAVELKQFVIQNRDRGPN